jgi:beta-glucosidase
VDAARIDGIVRRMTLEEKAAMLDGADFWHTQGVARLGLPPLMLTDGPHGLRKQAGAADHLGLNASVPATCFPPAAGLASSWDQDLVEEVGRALGAEARALDVAVVLGPGLNIKRSPLCGRNFEYLSEDPLVSGLLAAAMVRGVQSQGVGACLKHFAVNNQETDRMTVSAEVDPRTLREIYLAGFEVAVKTARPWMMMCSYNKIGGVYAASNRWLLTEVLRDEWGFDGVVVSDWGATHLRPGDLRAGLDLEMPSSSGHGAAEVLAALASGEITVDDVDRAVRRLVALAARVGALTPAAAPLASGDVRTGARTGRTADGDDGTAADSPSPGAGPAAEPAAGSLARPSEPDNLADSPHPPGSGAAPRGAVEASCRGGDHAAGPDGWQAAHAALAVRAAIRSAVLLKNEGTLPLAPDAGGPVAVIGQFAVRPRYQGAGSSAVNPTELTCALDSIRDLVAGRREVAYAEGFEIGGDQLDPAKAAEAVALARRSEVALVFLGLPPADESEGYDRDSITLPAPQLELLAQVAAANPNTVVVLANGGVVDVASWAGLTRAVLEGWLGGQGGGAAIAALVFGQANPSGKLAETIPLRLEDTPSFGNFPGDAGFVRHGEGMLVGYRWYDTRGWPVAYPFGHGLSYTSFEYSKARAQVVVDGARPQVEAAVTVRNTGQRTGREVVQVYLHWVGSGPSGDGVTAGTAEPGELGEPAELGEPGEPGEPGATGAAAVAFYPAQELRAFASVELAPGEAQELSWKLGPRAVSHWDAARDRWVVGGGVWELRFAASSRDLRQTVRLRLAGEDTAEPVTLDSAATAWLADAVHGPWLRAKLAGGPFANLLDDPTARALMGPTPLVRLLRFEGFPLTAAEVSARLSGQPADQTD